MSVSDFILEIDSIKGESADDKYKNVGIDIQSFSWGVSNQGTAGSAGGMGGGKSSFQDLHFMKNVDKSSPVLAEKCATGEHIAKATLHVRKAGGDQKEYYVIKLTDLLVSSFQASGSEGSATVMDSFSLNYSKIEWDYKPQDEKGNLGASSTFGYNIKTNKKV